MSRKLSLGRSRWRPLLGAAVTATLFLGLLVGIPITTATSAQAAPVTGFNPGNIISDSTMYDSRSMSAAQIQTFLNQRGSNCTPTSGNTCVKDYTERTPTRAATSLCTGTYQGAASESAASIIAKVSVACGINPQVLLVTLQKEQGLITASTGKSAATYSRALGFGCPDNAGGWCDPQYAGFGNQVYSAAQQLKRYAANPNGYAHRAGVVNQVRYHPNASCGSSAVYIENQATASLYNYTPYQPNAAALAAGAGTGDSCSSYGNRNFHLFFTEWFGSAVQEALPLGALDIVAQNSPGIVRVRGWAFDPDTSDSITIHIYANGKLLSAARADTARTDVARIYGVGNNHGYDTTVNLPTGVHDVCVYAIDSSSSGTNPRIGCKPISVTNQVPRGSVDVVRMTAPGAVQVRGWAFDPDTSASISVHIYVDGKAVKAVRADTTRADVARVHGVGTSHGYDTTINLTPGTHQVCVYAIDSSGGPNPRLGCATSTVTNSLPRGALDLVSQKGPGEMRVRGWAFDPDTSASISVHIYVDGKAVKAVRADTTRADVARVHGVGTSHGYDTTINLTPGTHQVCVYAIDSSGGPNPRLGCLTSVLQNSAVVGDLESATAQEGSVRPGAVVPGSLMVTGWARDPDSMDPTPVRVAVDGAVVASGVADARREDLSSTAPHGDMRLGFAFDVAVSPGERRACVQAQDSTTKAWSDIGCTVATVPNAAPYAVLDIAQGQSASVRVRGWVIDPDVLSPVTVHVYADGRLIGSARADGSRPDVARVYATQPERGFDAVFPVSSGIRNVCVYSINQPAGVNHVIRCQSLTIG